MPGATHGPHPGGAWGWALVVCTWAGPGGLPRRGALDLFGAAVEVLGQVFLAAPGVAGAVRWAGRSSPTMLPPAATAVTWSAVNAWGSR